MSNLYARVINEDGVEWTSNDVSDARGIHSGIMDVEVEGPSNCCLLFSIPDDNVATRKITRSIAKAYPGTPVYWTSTRKMQ